MGRWWTQHYAPSVHCCSPRGEVRGRPRSPFCGGHWGCGLGKARPLLHHHGKPPARARGAASFCTSAPAAATPSSPTTAGARSCGVAPAYCRAARTARTLNPGSVLRVAQPPSRAMSHSCDPSLD